MYQKAKKSQPIVMTKQNGQESRLVPAKSKSRPLFGRLRGTIRFKSDMVAPINEKWAANHN